LDGATGAKLWEFDTGDTIQYSSPAVGTDGTVYVGCYQGKVYALNGATGAKRWEFATGGNVLSSPAIGSDGAVYVASNSRLYALDGATGAKRWEYAMGCNWSSPAVGSDGAVYVGSLYAFDGATGTKQWEYPTGCGNSSPVIGPEGTVYVGAGGNKVIALYSSSVDGPANSPWPMFRQNACRTGWGGTGPSIVPVIYSHPRDRTVSAGLTAAFGVFVGGSSPLACQWQKDGVNLMDGGRISGATTTILRITEVEAADASSYTLVVSNAQGSATSRPAMLHVGPYIGLYLTQITGSATYDQVWLTFSSPLVPATATNTANYALSGGLTISRAALDATGTNVVLTTSLQTSGATYTLMVNRVRDKVGYTVAPNTQTSFRAYVFALGSLTREVYFGVEGRDVRNLTDSPKFLAHQPDLVTPIVWRFQAPKNIAEFYGQRLFGFVAPTQSDNYVFYVACDDSAEVWLSTDDSAANRRLIASVSLDCTGEYEWTKFATQKSAPIALQAGRRYYIEVLFKEGWGSDYVAVAWQRGNQPVEVIPAEYLGTSVEPDSWLAWPAGTPYVLADGQFLLAGPVIRGAPAQIELRTAFANGSIYYTLDGSAPSFAATEYRGTFTVAETARLRAIAYSSDYSRSAEAAPMEVTIWPSYPLGVINPGGGTVTADPPNGPYISNSVVRLRASPASGWAFLNWTGAVVGSNDTIDVTMDKPKWIQAAFATPVNTGVAGQGSVALYPSPGPYACGSTLRAMAIPASGQYFLRWGNAASGTASPLDFVVSSANPTITALFAPLGANQVSLTALANGPGSLSLNPAKNVFNRGETVTLTAVAGLGVKFSHWSGDASGSANPLTLTMDASKNVGANFLDLPGAVLWEFANTGPGNFSPVLDRDGNVVIRAGSMLLGLNPATGWKQWEFQPPDAVRSLIADAEGILYGIGGGRCFALDVSRLKVTWQIDLAAKLPALSRNRTLYLPGPIHGRGLHAIDAQTGRTNWTFTTKDPFGASVGADGMVFLSANLDTEGSTKDYVFAVDGVTGAEKWRFITGSGCACIFPPTIGADGTVYAGSQYLYALDGATGAEKWRFQLDRGMIVSSPVINGTGTLFFGTSEGQMLAVASATGQKLWLFQADAGVYSSPALAADGTVYTASAQRLYALNQATGEVKWDFARTYGGGASSPVVGPDGTVYFEAGDYKVYALRGSAPLADSPWPMFQQNPGHAGQARPEPVVVKQPGRQEVVLGGTMRLTVQSYGAAPMVYQWLKNGVGLVDGGRITGATTATLTISNVQLDDAGNYEVVVSNTAGSVTSQPAATVVLINRAPTLAAIADQTVNELATLSLTATATDPDVPANTLTYSLVSGPAGASINAASGALNWTPTEAQGPSTNVLTVKVTDNGTPPLSDSKSFTVVVKEVNSAPTLAAIADQMVDELKLLSVQLSATDADVPANNLTFGLVSGPSGLTASAAGLVAWTPTEAQGPSTNTVKVKVTDDGSPTLSATNSFTVVVKEVNTAPVLAAVADQAVDELKLLSVQLSATDADLPANKLTFGLVSGPTGLTVSAAGLVAWTPTEAQGPSTNTVKVKVTDDGSPTLSATNSFTVVVKEVNTAPTLAAIADQTAKAGTLLTVTCQATDADIPANRLTFKLTAGPIGMVIDANSGAITWTPTQGQVGATNQVTVSVTDDGVPALSDTESFTIVVKASVTGPIVIQTPQVVPGQSCTLKWNSEPGATYRVLYRDNLDAAAWSVLTELTAGSQEAVFTDRSLRSKRFYMVEAVP
jgi:outer membrane protein assembly factor BamB